MNKTSVKNFAVWARNKLIADIRYRAGLMGITENGIASPLPQSTGTTEFYDIGTAEPYSISGRPVAQRGQLVEAIRRRERDEDYKTAYHCIIEEVAYTWFNRLIAVRFMEVNDYLPSHIRVLSSETGKLEPDLVTRPFDAGLPFTVREEADLIQMRQDNKLDEAFRLLFIRQCNALNEILPALFEKTGHYTELLLNLSVIDRDGVVWHLVHDIDEADFDVAQGGQVEIIGWLYQYYNTEPKDETFALLKKKVKVTRERIPSATQLFTPIWVVHYMVENSLGRLWIERDQAQGDRDRNRREGNRRFQSEWNYYLDEAEQDPDVREQAEEIRREYRELNPEDIRVIDPCMGSGNILVCAFDVLMQIYESQGYTQRDAAQSILKHNLYGLDIDERAAQLAYFSVMMKARQYDRRIFSRDIQPHMYAIVESNGLSGLWTRNNPEMQKLFDCMKDAKAFGSLLAVPALDFDGLRNQAAEKTKDITTETFLLQEQLPQVLTLIDVAEILAGKYEIVCTNPPYMAASNAKETDYIRKNYPDSKSDFFAAFIERCEALTAKNGYQAMITQHAWMFLSSFEKLRGKLLEKDIINMAHLGPRAFEEIGGEVVQTTSFVLRNSHIADYKGTYCRLTEPATQQGKEELFLAGKNRYTAQRSCFAKIPGSPVAYWVSAQFLKCYDHAKISDVAFSDGQILTGNNEKYLRLIWEVNAVDIAEKKWVLHAKGGEFRRWYGNIDTVVRFDPESIRHYRTDPVARFPKEEVLFRRGITWTLVSMNPNFGVRELSDKLTFNKAAATILFRDDEKINYVLGFLNTKVAQALLKAINPTMNNNIKDILAMPYIESESRESVIHDRVDECIAISKEDWDYYEESWDFRRHPLILERLTVGRLISDIYKEWESECNTRFLRLKSNEEELNRLFIDIYGLQGELDPAVEEKDVTVRRADLGRDVRSLLSYAAGCMFGRYSLDVEGLVYAGGRWDDRKYSSFIPDTDNVIPITDEEYLEDDMVSRLCTWLETVYGADTLEQNLDFIASALGNKGSTSREAIRNYFLKDFFRDHCRIYQKRPIYWLFDSGKQNGFKALIYLHRYHADTIGCLRVDYLHRMQQVYESEICRMQDIVDHSDNPREIAQAVRRREKLQKQLKECREYDEKISHLALARIGLDMDEGVKVNYEKIQTARDGKRYPVLAKI